MKLYKEWNSIKLRFIVMLLLMVGAAVAIVSLRNFTINLLNSPQMRGYLKNTPYKGFSMILKKISSDFSYYSFSQWFGKNYPQLAALVAVILSFSIFSKEKEKRTFYVVFGRMNRWEIYSSKMLIGYLSLVTIMFSGSFGYLLTALVFNYHLSFFMTISWTVMATVGAALLYQIGAYTSLLFKDQIKPFLLDILIYAGLYISGIFKPTKFLDIFNYMAKGNVLRGNGIDVLTTIVICSICLAIFVGEYFQFKYMDL